MPKNIAYISFFVLMFAIGILIKNPFILNMLSIAALSVIVILGLDLLMGFAGQVSLGHAGFVAMGAYISSLLSIKLNINPWLAILIAVLITSLLASIIAYPTMKLKGHYLAMATLAIGEIVYILLNNLTSLTGGHQGLSGMPMLSIGNFVFDSDKKFYFLVWLIVSVITFIIVNITNSSFGRSLRLIKEKEPAAVSFGINAHMLKIVVFTISATLASLAGGLFAFYLGFISPASFSLLKSIDYVVMVFVGGMGTVIGPMIMSVILTVLPNILLSLQEFWPIVNGILLVVMVMFLPEGIGGIIKWKKRLF
ncbi:branched-chain amino acid ABC transporter permease [Hippea alviniae]|uniref:branched-chain amino acid ABC transporter permease n=1 Tax=Hippea alviniae TaxID=1279027 RepID=UPI0003B5F657|nr:branched-chain amino acid ABC transporter permease [Hippea alviniae]